MNVKWTLAAAAVIVAVGTRADADSSSVYTVTDGASTELTSFLGGSECTACQDAGTACGSCDSCESEPWRLFPEIGCGWNLTGWVSAGATANANSPASRLNGPVTFNDRTNFQANQFYMSFGRDLEGGSCGLEWGGRVDLMFGSDYFFTQAAGLELRDNGTRHSNRSGNQYGLALPQVYGEVGYGDVSLKVGHFYTILNNEVVTAPDNFFYSHAYTMQYGEPFTHTGGLVTWQYSDSWVLYGGIVNGWDKLDANSDRASFLGGATYTPCDGRYEVTATLIYGDEDGVGNINHTRTMYSIVFRYNVSDKLEYVLQHDNGWNDYDAGGLDEEWYGVNQYLFYNLNDCWTFGLRAEWFRDDDGSRIWTAPLRSGVGGPVPPPPVNNNAAFAGNYYNVSAGLNWTPTTNIIVRPEIRFDWSDGTLAAPYDDFTKDSQMTAAFDAIWLY
jgi:hypothetical protein